MNDIEVYHNEVLKYEALDKNFRELEKQAIDKLPKPEPKPILKELWKRVIKIKRKLI